MATILLVDDEAGIRDTLSAILEQHGFAVVTAATVADGLREINERSFDILISDLNVGEPGDGFTVVSAMRRTQPRCRTIILTGYPEFESALEAIRNQVDDYIVKPANIAALIQSLQRAVANPRNHSGITRKSVPDIIEENRSAIISDALQAMKSHPELGPQPLSDAERIDHLPELLLALASQLRSATPNQAQREGMKAAANHGRTRCEQGYALKNLVDDSNLVERAIYDTLQMNMLALDLSRLVPDLKRVNEALDARLKASIAAYLEERERNAA